MEKMLMNVFMTHTFLAHFFFDFAFFCQFLDSRKMLAGHIGL